MDASVGTKVHVARHHLARFIGVRSFYDEDQFIADVAMERKFGARFEPYEDGAALAFLVLPNRFLAHPRHRVRPRDVTQHEGLRSWRVADFGHRRNAAADYREYRGAEFTRHSMHASVGPIADAAGRDDTGLIGNCALDYVQQFVAVVAMHWQRRAGFEASYLRAPFCSGIRPQRFGLDGG